MRLSMSQTPFAQGATVQLHPASIEVLARRGGAPTTPALATAVVDAAGALLFTGLEADTEFWLAGQDPQGTWRWVKVHTDASQTAAFDVEDPEDIGFIVDVPADQEEDVFVLRKGGTDLMWVDADGVLHLTGVGTDQGDVVLHTQVAAIVEHYGAVGDDTVDDTAAIQEAIDAVAAAGGGRVIGKPGATYRISCGTSKTFMNGNGSTGVNYFALELPSGVLFDLQGATLKMHDGGHIGAAICNEGSNALTDHDLGLVNGTIDGDGLQLTGVAVAMFNGVTRLRLRDLRFKNTTRACIQTQFCSQGDYDELYADGHAGNAFVFGQPFLTPNDAREIDSTFGRIVARNLTPDALNAFNFPGNPFYGCLERCTIDTLIAKTCSGGVKIDRPGTDVVIGKVLMHDGTAENSGLKIQGSNEPTYVSNVSIGQVLARAQRGAGLNLDQYCQDVQVGSYMGIGNDLSGSWPDVWFAGKRCRVGQIKSFGTGSTGVEVRSTAAGYHIGDCEVRNAGQVAGSGSGNSLGISVEGGSGVIDNLVCIDDQAVPTMNRLYDVNGASALLRVGNVTAYAENDLAVFRGTLQVGTLMLNPRLHPTDPLYGEFSPANGAILTDVVNGNIRVDGAGGTIQPLVEIIPINASARALAGVWAGYDSGTLHVHHAAAAGTEKFLYRIVAQTRHATQPT